MRYSKWLQQPKILIFLSFAFVFFGNVLSTHQNQQLIPPSIKVLEAQHNEKYEYIRKEPTSFSGGQQQEEVLMTIFVEPGHFECFYQQITNTKHKVLEIDYQVIGGGEKRDINFILKSPKGIIIANDFKQQDGEHKVEIEKENSGYGDYMLCFDNTFSYTARKRIFFEIFLMDKDGNYLNDYDINVLSNAEKYAVQMQLTNFQRTSVRVRDQLNKIERIQAQHKAAEARDRTSVEILHRRVDFWSAISLFCLLFAGAAQVYTMRSLFMEDSKLGRFVRAGFFKNYS